MPITVLSPLPETDRAAAADLYWQAFRGKLGRVLAPEPVARALLAETLRPDHAICAYNATGQLVGLAGFKTSAGGFIDITLRDLTRHYGQLGGLGRGLFLSLLDRPMTTDVLLMDGICVAAEAREQGVGTLLLRAIQAEATGRALSQVRLDVIDSNLRARALYTREGFVAVAEHDHWPFHHLLGTRRSTEMLWTAACRNAAN